MTAPSGRPAVTGANNILQDAATEAAVWSKKNKVALNGDKTKEMCICFSRVPSNPDKIVPDDRDIELVSETKLLGVVFINDLKWQAHIDAIVSRSSK